MTDATELPDGSGPDARLSPTAYALLGLLAFTERSDVGLTGYEIKQMADRTLRFYWVSPAMSQVYSEMGRLVRAGMVAAQHDAAGARPTTRYVITDDGRVAVRTWMDRTAVGFPVLKHPVALRLLMGHLSTPEAMRAMLEEYRASLAVRRAELQGVRDQLGDREEVRYPAMVADWGLDYYDAEARIVTSLADRAGQVPGVSTTARTPAPGATEDRTDGGAPASPPPPGR
ncbi:PadR family transcriptional regulator [Actinotalea sp. K2]|uniref:PadR family transcriptional regulator n=1 Tax=Actinotalea sp. K2 TaxID=2939438 RepID=UPI00201792C6|nr:helix-turn-helix transcriptional regulator [Actinotalea sp. K2]MCL3862259.1 PadR family transcriptional regulator [Actinotalea sp. K2]